jgi:single-stranded-DNA-specific exonuclease
MLATTATHQWVLHPDRDLEQARGLARELGAPLAAAVALVNRGVRNAADARQFLQPTLEDLNDPFLLLDLDRAVDRIRTALVRGERILVHGDYDVDGITSTFMLVSVLRDLGAQVEYRIPHRLRDGYGVSDAAIEDAEARGCSLILTVDCGITANGPVANARARGIDTVITDHHEPPEVLPDALAVVNPLRHGCAYPFKSLAGVGVTFKLVQALLRGRGGLERAAEYLDVVAIGTIADVVPLVGENRVLARLGLERLNRQPRIGLQALMGVAGGEGRLVTSGHVAFVLAPRINAGGRMGDAEQGLRLLLSSDLAEARTIAASLEEDNDQRRRRDEEALIEAAAQVESELSYPECSSILLWSDRWHPGVIGIVASRLVERFHRPTILVSVNDGLGRGSGRSMAGLDLNLALGRCAELLEGFGGHAFAAGLSIRAERLPELRARFEALVREQMTPEDFTPRLTVDGDLGLSECDLALIEWLERMSPHGLGNPEPLFVVRGARVSGVSAVGAGRHLRFHASDGTGSAGGIGFGFGEHVATMRATATIDLACAPSRNEWMGETRVQLKLKGMRPA